jgi:hypothetical protein
MSLLAKPTTSELKWRSSAVFRAKVHRRCARLPKKIEAAPLEARRSTAEDMAAGWGVPVEVGACLC